MLRKRSSQKEVGQGMVEFAIVFPLIVILILAIFEFGRVMFAYSVSIAAAREAARYGAAIQDIGGGIPQYKIARVFVRLPKESVSSLVLVTLISLLNIVMMLECTRRHVPLLKK